MFGTGTCFYDIKQKARCLNALLGDTEHHRFLVGTTSLKQPNEIHLIEFNEEANKLKCEEIYSHPNEVWDLTPSPSDPSLLFTCQNIEGKLQATLWEMKPDGEEQNELKLLSEIPAEGSTEKVLWNASNLEEIATMHENTVRKWSLKNAGDDLQEISSLALEGDVSLNTMCWDPHHQDEIVFNTNSSLNTWDLRTSKIGCTINNAHSQTVLDVDYNPNKPYNIVSGGDDCKVKFWDLRNPSRPLQVFSDHSHWVWNVKFNRFHDQLVLSSGSDSLVNLWRVSSISSAPLLELDEDNTDSSIDLEDTKILSYEEHEDSVYSLVWGASDSWIFGSLSYDGRVALNHVPSTEKYKILL